MRCADPKVRIKDSARSNDELATRIALPAEKVASANNIFNRSRLGLVDLGQGIDARTFAALP
jgi:hypothetical protein